MAHNIPNPPAGGPAPGTADTGEMPLTSREGSVFDVVLRGYDRQQVEERLAQWAQALTGAERQRDAALAALQQARAQAARNSVADQLSDRLREILRLAEDEADAIREQARQEVSGAVGQAREQAEQLRAAARREVDQASEQAREQAELIVGRAHAEAEHLLAQAKAEAEDVAADTARVRAEGRREHEQALSAQRAEQAAERQQLEAEIAELERRRDQVRTDVARLRDALAASVGTMLPDA